MEDFPEYIQTRMVEWERGNDIEIHRIYGIINANKTLTREVLEDTCVKKFGYKKGSGSFAGCLLALKALGKISMKGRGKNRIISVNE